MAPVPSTSTNMTGNNSHQSTATGSPSHHIPFHSTNHQPSQLGFGFGFGSSFSSPSNPTSNPSTSLQWGRIRLPIHLDNLLHPHSLYQLLYSPHQLPIKRILHLTQVQAHGNQQLPESKMQNVGEMMKMMNLQEM